MDLPRISVLIPCFNDGAYLAEALASIREDEHVQVVVSDDGSTDPLTLQVLADIEEDHIPVVRGANAGPGAARTRGLAACQGRYVFTLDADDRVGSRGVLGRMADLLDASPTAGFCTGDYRAFGSREGLWVTPDFHPWLCLWANWWSPTAMFRTQLLRDVGGWRAAHGYEDWYLWMDLAERGEEGVKVDEVIWERRLHAGRQQSRDRAHHAEIYRALRVAHPDLFSREQAHRNDFSPSRGQRLFYPLVLGARPLMPQWAERMILSVKMRLTAIRAERSS